MYRSRHPRRIGTTADALGPGAVVAFLFCAVVSAIVYGCYALDASETNRTARSNIELLKLLDSYGDDAKDSSEAAVQSRKENAQRYITLEDAAEEVNDDAEHLGFDDDQWKQVKKVAETGKPPKLDTDIMSYSAPFSWPFLPLWLLGIWFLTGIGSLLSYVDEMPSERLADVNWKRWSSWLVTFGFGPLVWIAMVVSRVLLIWTPYETTYDPPQPVDDQIPDRDDPAPEEEPPQKTPNQTYVSAPAAARNTYVSLRTDAAKGYQAVRLKEVDSNIENHQEAARNLGTQLRKIQGDLNQLRATRTQLTESLDSEVVTAETANQEFDRITRLPGIIATQVVNDHLRLIIRATHEYKDRVYDLGDWRIDLRLDSGSIQAYSIRYQLRRGWSSGTYPSYTNGDGSFCFGDRQETLNEHLRKGQYLEAVSVAIDSLCGINKGERKLVPSAFFPIEN